VRFVVFTKVKWCSAIRQIIVQYVSSYVPERSAAFILNHEDRGRMYIASVGAYPHHMID
jgi:hypothetical protein